MGLFGLPSDVMPTLKAVTKEMEEALVEEVVETPTVPIKELLADLVDIFNEVTD